MYNSSGFVLDGKNSSNVAAMDISYDNRFIAAGNHRVLKIFSINTQELYWFDLKKQSTMQKMDKICLSKYISWNKTEHNRHLLALCPNQGNQIGIADTNNIMSYPVIKAYNLPEQRVKKISWNPSSPSLFVSVANDEGDIGNSSLLQYDLRSE